MSKPRTLKTATDYRPALLWLMGQLERATTSEALAEFERLLGDLIPPAHRGEIKSGKIKWDWYVRWSRQDLLNAGLMGSGGRGVWTITPQGQQWLAGHPDGGGDELKALLKPVRKGTAPRTAATRPAPGRRTRSRTRRTKTEVGLSFKDLKHIKQHMPADEFQTRFGERWQTLLAEERARIQTDVSDQELARRARQILQQVHTFLKGEGGAISSEKACDWMQFCYALGLYRETAALFAYVSQDDLPEWAYERARKMAEACRARLGS
jgi:hypothetical protein